MHFTYLGLLSPTVVISPLVLGGIPDLGMMQVCLRTQALPNGQAPCQNFKTFPKPVITAFGNNITDPNSILQTDRICFNCEAFSLSPEPLAFQFYGEFDEANIA